jgi:serine protease AprX
MSPNRGFTWAVSKQAGRAAAVVVALAVVILGAPAASAATTGSAADPYSMASITAAMGATDWWNSGYTGAGVDVAIIDSGVAPVLGLNGPNKVVYGPDLSLESQAPALTNLDTFGHGTFMAGLIAGDDGTAGGYRGLAPDARLLSLKVATADGGADVTQVIAAINWVVQHKNDNGLNVRVLNLSYGTNSLQSSSIDPLSYAVEQAWKQGIVVVASAGNSGYQRGRGAPGLASPAYNPFIIGVGGFDSKGTSDWHDDIVAPYSASSTGQGGAKNPDFVAPGSHLQGLRVPNSFIDASHPEGRMGDRFFRGSGTSEAAAVTSGAIALLLQKYPALSPDAVKRFIMDNAQKVPSFDSQAQGAGELTLRQMAQKSPKAYAQNSAAATGQGTIEGARGQDHIARDGVVLQGERDIFGATLNSSNFAPAEAAGSTWTDGSWNGNTWTGNTWSGNTWKGNTWKGNAWDGNAWSGNTWSGNSWSGNTWSGNTWKGNSWSGNTWSGNTWASDSWS